MRTTLYAILACALLGGLAVSVNARSTAADQPVAAIAATPTPARLTLARSPGNSGVRLTWNWRGPGSPQAFRIRRAVGDPDVERPDGLTECVTTWTLPVATTGRWTDPAPADGARYTYVAEADSPGGAVTSTPLTVDTPVRPLPSLKAPAIYIDKATYTLTVVDAGLAVKRYPVALGRNPVRRKLSFDNASTPEGVYHILQRQPRATYHRAYDLDYPNATDRLRYRLAAAATPGFPPIGGEIQIHGHGIGANWTFGCIALRNEDIDELFSQPAIGVGTEVRIWGGELTEGDVAALAKHP